MEELALANSVKQTGAPRRWKNSEMVNEVDKNNISLCVPLLCPRCASLSPSGEQE